MCCKNQALLGVNPFFSLDDGMEFWAKRALGIAKDQTCSECPSLTKTGDIQLTYV